MTARLQAAEKAECPHPPVVYPQRQVLYQVKPLPLLVGICLFGLAALALPPAANAACPGVIASGETQTTPQTLANQGETCTVESGGTIRTNNANGINTSSNRHVISNFGTIQTSGFQVRGVEIRGRNNVLSNFGTIQATGAQARGVFIRGRGNVFYNGGTIEASGTRSLAIRIQTPNNQMNTLTLLPGSRIIGDVRLAGGGSETVNFYNRVGTVITFDFTSGTGLPEVIDTNGRPFVTIPAPGGVGNPYVVVVDPTAFGQNDERLADLTGAMFGAIHTHLDDIRRLPAVASGPTSRASMQIGVSVADEPFEIADPVVDTVIDHKTNLWAQVIGAHRREEEKGISNEADHNLLGVIIGFDSPIDTDTLAGLRLGGFLGAAVGETEIGYNSQHIDTTNFFGGIYGEYAQENWYTRLTLGLGIIDHDSTRLVMDNLAPNGSWNARASYDGMFISPEFAVGADYDMSGTRISPSLKLRYGYMSLDGYTETGAPANVSPSLLTIADRDVNLLLGRAQIAFARTWRALDLRPRIGVEGHLSDSDNVSASIAGTALSFAPAGEKEAISGFVGATVSADFGGEATAYVDAEAHLGNNGYRFAASLGLSVRF